MKEKETWKDIPGYEGLYQASTMGRIRSLDREIECKDGQVRFYEGKVKKPRKKNDDALTVTLSKNGHLKTYNVHKLIMHTFKGERPEGYHICHKNGDCADNRLENLRYDTPSQNNIDMYRYGGKSGPGKLSVEQALEIRKLYATGDYTQTELAVSFGVGQSSIGKVILRQTFSWLNDDGAIDDTDTAVS